MTCASSSAISSRSRASRCEVHRGEVVCLIGPSGSGKSTLLRCTNALETIRRRRGSCSTACRCPAAEAGHAARAPAHGHGVPELRAVSAQDRARERRDRADRRCSEMSEDDARAPRRGAARQGRAGRQGGQLSGQPVGRTAAARRDRPRAGDGAGGDAVRRADLGARPGDDRRGAERDEDAGRGRHDDGRRHARDDASRAASPTGSSCSTMARSSSRDRPRRSSTRRTVERTRDFLSHLGWNG